MIKERDSKIGMKGKGAFAERKTDGRICIYVAYLTIWSVNGPYMCVPLLAYNLHDVAVESNTEYRQRSPGILELQGAELHIPGYREE